MQGGRLVGIMMPADWTAADLTFQASVDGSLWHNVYDEADAEVTVQAAEDRLILIAPERWVGVRQLKVRSGTSGAAVNQGGARSVTLVVTD